VKYSDFFKKAYGKETEENFGPYDYQEKLAKEPWPELLEVPTGMGKTAAIILAWLYKRRFQHDADTPRRLTYCLPMRVLVEQTERNVREWLENLNLLGNAGEGKVSVHLIMGGEPDTRSWVEYPEEDMIILGTQDMLLSRALMRGYGMSRYRWPIDFALLHNDALWVYDEIQLMGPALPTSTQLEAFRRSEQGDSAYLSRSLWMSATLKPDWLNSIDFRVHSQDLNRLCLSQEEKQAPAIIKRWKANKQLNKAATQLGPENRKKNAADYIDTLADEVINAHVAETQTLIIINRVERAQDLYKAIGKKLKDVPRLLLHARFRPTERRAIEHALHNSLDDKGRIIIATQAIEAGVDISSRLLFTELAPWSSLVQRFGRCNRAGEHDVAEIRWIDIAGDANEYVPYDAEALSTARQTLEKVTSASPSDLPGIEEAFPVTQVLRRKDFLELFNTDPDLSGFDIDISPYIRDTGTPQVQVFWRDFEEKPVGEAKPYRNEICPVSITQINAHLGKESKAWCWDSLAGEWVAIQGNRIRPGMTLMLRVADGGYDPQSGFLPKSKKQVSAIKEKGLATEEDYVGDPLTTIGRWVSLTEHLQDVAGAAEDLCGKIGVEKEVAELLITAGRWHDIGKAHPAFQHALNTTNAEHPAPDNNTMWAKSANKGCLQYGIPIDEKLQKRPYFRHELASALAWLEHKQDHPHVDLIAYLIAAHHGKVRLGLRALPNEKEPDDDRLFARGVWTGDKLPQVRLNGELVPETVLKLDLMQLGESPEQGASWTTRTRRLLSQYGPFQLARLETVVRLADWRASRMEQENKND
jgi:CRISPR-associated endonuclease/helicase Cas3